MTQKNEERGFTITTQVTIPLQRIADLMVGSIEGESGYWCSGVYLHTKHDLKETPWYSDPSLYGQEFAIQVVEYEASEEDSDGRHNVNKEKLARGLQIMSEKHPSHFADLMNEQDDAITADIFLQCVALGEVVYG